MLEAGVGERRDALLHQLVEVRVRAQHVGAQKRSERILAANLQAHEFRIDARPIVLDGGQRLIDRWQVESCDHGAHATPRVVRNTYAGVRATATALATGKA